MAGVVWMLGAGFSRFLGAPLLSELFTEDSVEDLGRAYKLNGADAMAANVVATVFKDGKGRFWKDAEEFVDRLDSAAQNPAKANLMDRHIVAVSGTEKFKRAMDIGQATDPLSAIQRLSEHAIWTLAMETSLFLEGADTSDERWSPYRALCERLEEPDTVLTFNYDIVPELLKSATLPKLNIMVPGQQSATDGPMVIKMHGSVTWREANNVVTVRPFVPADHNGRVLIATPGVTKQRTILAKAFQPLWSRAASAIENASALVIVGYRLPPTDAGTTQWLVKALRRWLERNGSSNLPIHIVLGPGTFNGEAQRLRLLCQSLSERVKAMIWPISTEDFLGL